MNEEQINEDIAGVWIGKRTGTEFEIYLEYVKDKYRDCGPGHYIYHDRQGYFRSEGINIFTVKKIFAAHAAYLQKIGFKKGVLSHFQWVHCLC